MVSNNSFDELNLVITRILIQVEYLSKWFLNYCANKRKGHGANYKEKINTQYIKPACESQRAPKPRLRRRVAFKILLRI